MKSVAILGSGLAGMLAAKAIQDMKVKWDFTLFSKDKKLHKPKGFVMLHDKCGIKTLDDATIKVVQKGRENKYKNKLNYDGMINSSWKSGLADYYVHGWDIRDANKFLHNIYRTKFSELEITPNNINDILRDYDYVISTIPPDNLTEDITLKYSKVYIREVKDDYKKVEQPVVYYHGDLVPGTRVTLNLWGKSWVEYGKLAPRRFFSGDIELEDFRKPVSASGTMPSADNLILAGRYGLWNKNILSHQVYYRIKGMIDRGEIA